MGTDNEQLSFKKRFRKRTRAFRHGFQACLESVVLGPAGLIVPRVSRKMECRMASLLAKLLRVFARRSRRIVLANLDIAYGDSKTPEEKREILLGFYRHIAQVMLDYFWFSHQTEARLSVHCWTDDETINRWLDGNFPGIMVTAHLGNWEVAGHYVAYRNRKLWSVYRPIGTRKTLRNLLSFRRSIGQEVIPREGAASGIYRALRSNGLVALLLDQHTEVTDGGEYFPFFSLPATFSMAGSVFAKRMGVPICIAGELYDAKTDTYVMRAYDEITVEDMQTLDANQITERIIQSIERMIRENPHQWLWGYRRWKRYRSCDNPKDFPFYARQCAYR